MNILKIVRDDFDTLRDGQPGSRFRTYAETRRERCGSSHNFRRALSLAFAMLLCVVGLSIGWLPGPGGFLAIIGLALIAKEIPAVAGLLDRLEVLGRRGLGCAKKALGGDGPPPPEAGQQDEA